MFRHAIRHPSKKARIDIRNNLDLTALTLAAKLGRKELFIECLELSHVVSRFFFSSVKRENERSSNLNIFFRKFGGILI
jgi:hypothetical protein